MTYQSVFKIIISIFILTPAPVALGQEDRKFPQYKVNIAVAEGRQMLVAKMMDDYAGIVVPYGGRLQLYPFISDYRTDQIFTEPRPKVIDESVEARIRGFAGHEAIKAIVKASGGRQIVILNEAHDKAQHRAFGLQLAAALRAEGFTYMAAEAFAPRPDRKKNPIKYPDLKTGYYTKDPIFADFVRQGINMGYRLVPYEITSDQRAKIKKEDSTSRIINRETSQAKNIIENILKDDPKARIFIYVGYAHATENWKISKDGREVGWMAAQIKRMTGIDPLTIDQVYGTDGRYSNNRANDVVYDYVTAQEDIHSSLIMKNKAGAFLTSKYYDGKIDLTVFHPKQAMIEGRPNWLYMSGYRKAFKIENKDFFKDRNIMLQAFVISEIKSAIPMDQLVIRGAEGHQIMLLPKGKYRLEAQDADGNISKFGTAEYIDGQWKVWRKRI
jgi:hypothetical protein